MPARRMGTATKSAATMALVVTALVVTMAATSTSATGSPGELDTGFGTDGVVAGTPLATWGPVTTDAEGRIVVLGTGPGGAPAVARLLPDGSPDTAFAGDGRADVAVDGVERTALGVRVLADGTVVAVGTALEDPEMPFSAFAYVARFTTSGAPASFGTGGVAERSIGGPSDDVVSAAISPNGTVVVSVTQGLGNTGFESVGPDAMFTSFDAAATTAANPPGATGCVRMSFGPAPMVFTSADRFVHAGNAFYMCDGGQSFEYHVVTLQAVGGAAVWSVRLPAGEEVPDDTAAKPAALSGGVVIGSDAPGGATLRRFDPQTGALDPGFGSGGIVELPASFGAVGAVAALAGNRIGVVSAGEAFGDDPAAFRLLRLDPGGGIDPTFPAVEQTVGGGLRRAHLAGAPDAGLLVTTQTDTASVLRRYLGGSPTTPGELTPLQPGRLLDTRQPGGSTVDGQFAAIGTRSQDTVLELDVGGRGGVPADASAVVLNVTVVDARGAGFVTVWPCEGSAPNASNLNFVAGQTVPNAVVVKLSDAGSVCILNAQADVDLLADVNGFFPAGSGYEPLLPDRLLDTRAPGGSTVDGQFAAGGTNADGAVIELQVTERAGVPAGAAAVTLNVTVVEAQGAGFVTVWPCEEPQPNASSLNFAAGQTVPNAVISKVGADGKVCLVNVQADVDLLADVNGFFP